MRFPHEDGPSPGRLERKRYRPSPPVYERNFGLHASVPLTRRDWEVRKHGEAVMRRLAWRLKVYCFGTGKETWDGIMWMRIFHWEL